MKKSPFVLTQNSSVFIQKKRPKILLNDTEQKKKTKGTRSHTQKPRE
jgi:hypothetical protein